MCECGLTGRHGRLWWYPWGVLEVEDFEDGAEGVVRWGWAYVPGLAWVDWACGGWVVGVGDDGLEVRAEGRW